MCRLLTSVAEKNDGFVRSTIAELRPGLGVDSAPLRFAVDRSAPGSAWGVQRGCPARHHQTFQAVLFPERASFVRTRRDCGLMVAIPKKWNSSLPGPKRAR